MVTLQISEYSLKATTAILPTSVLWGPLTKHSPSTTPLVSPQLVNSSFFFFMLPQNICSGLKKSIENFFNRAGFSIISVSVALSPIYLSTFHQQMRQKDGAELLQASVSVKPLKDTGDRATLWLLVIQEWGNLRIKQPKSSFLLHIFGRKDICSTI